MNLAPFLVTPDQSMREVMRCIDRNASGIALVVDDAQRLLGTLTDGDIRRAILAGAGLDVPAQRLLDQRPAGPISAAPGTPMSDLLILMKKHSVRQIPLVDEQGRVVDLALLSELVKEPTLPLRAVVMAGGYGTRLRPLTDATPKPMLPLGGRPLLELTIEQLRRSGIRQLHVATHYRGDAIAKHFGDGHNFGVEIHYVQEDSPLGTAGALQLLEESSEPVLVINGDIVTRVDFRALAEFHKEQAADMTIGVRLYEFRVPYGVVETDGAAVRAIVEKPVMQQFINAGIYLLSPEVCRLVPPGQPYDMPQLISDLLARGGRVVSFPIAEYWLDIGQAEDYRQALADVEQGEV